MSKTEVYSWRISPELKSALEETAHAERQSVGRLLEQIVVAWLEQQQAAADDEETQRRIRQQALKYVGAIRGDDPRRAQEAAQRVKAILKEKHAPRRSD